MDKSLDYSRIIPGLTEIRSLPKDLIGLIFSKDNFTFNNLRQVLLVNKSWYSFITKILNDRTITRSNELALDLRRSMIEKPKNVSTFTAVGLPIFYRITGFEIYVKDIMFKTNKMNIGLRCSEKFFPQLTLKMSSRHTYCGKKECVNCYTVKLRIDTRPDAKNSTKNIQLYYSDDLPKIVFKKVCYFSVIADTNMDTSIAFRNYLNQQFLKPVDKDLIIIGDRECTLYINTLSNYLLLQTAWSNEYRELEEQLRKYGHIFTPFTISNKTPNSSYSTFRIKLNPLYDYL